jgi:hypothetical protein
MDEKPRRGTRRGPLGDARPDADGPEAPTSGGQPQEKVEDRPVVSKVRPEDYPYDQRAKGER